MLANPVQLSYLVVNANTGKSKYITEQESREEFRGCVCTHSHFYL